MEVNLDSDDEQNAEIELFADDEPESDTDGQQFDITLAATHSYMGDGLVEVGGRNVLEAGWEGVMPVVPHHGVVFPGETVPMLINNANDIALITNAINSDKLFGLIFPDGGGQTAGGVYGVVCEVFEAALSAASVTVKARAVHRFKLVKPHECRAHESHRMRAERVRVLAEVRASCPLRHARLSSLDSLRALNKQDRTIKTLDASVTPWPMFIYEIFDYERMRKIIMEYFATLGLEHLVPEEATSLSFWVASNLTLSARDRLALFCVDDALQRLHMECAFIDKKSVLCCTTCMSEIARREHVFAMSSDGVHSNYTNLGGYVHDVVTVRAARGAAGAGGARGEYSWFPGYAWRVAVCAHCEHHVGWRFTALRPHLRPAAFYGLCRNFVQPREAFPQHDDDDTEV